MTERSERTIGTAPARSARPSAARECDERSGRRGGGPVLRAGRRRWTSAAWRSPTPTDTRPCTGSTCASNRVSGSRCSARTVRARRRSCCHLNGILRAGAGSVSVGGLPVAPATLREIRRRVGIVFQDPDDQLFMPTVGDDVAFGPANFGVTGPALRERVDAALAAVDMLAYRDRSPLHLSGGQRRRVALATVLACRPEILVLDEPSSNLDPVARRELAEVLLGLEAQGRGTSMLMVTHDLPYALTAVPAQRDPRRRRDRRRRADPRAARRPGATGPPPARAAVRVHPDLTAAAPTDAGRPWPL